MKLLAWPGYGSQEVRNSVQVRCGGSALCFTQLTAHFTDFPLRVADSLWRSQRICDTRNEGRSRTLPSFPLFFPFSFFLFATGLYKPNAVYVEKIADRLLEGRISLPMRHRKVL